MVEIKATNILMDVVNSWIIGWSLGMAILRYNTLLKPDIGNTTPQVNDICSVDKMLTWTPIAYTNRT